MEAAAGQVGKRFGHKAGDKAGIAGQRAQDDA